ncbi:MAG: hypothetical protein EOP54_27990 [Sphingobacteriales bacterium]|nr:MAG: hypothetical protein EOP54_27990 [Sphingobacteriales bacterium]
MNAYQQKWIDILRAAAIKDWDINPVDNDIYIEMPHVSDLKLIRDNLPSTLAALSLDINLPHERLKFIFHNGYENFEYVLNPSADDLNKE